jgi:hypothetical protein
MIPEGESAMCPKTDRLERELVSAKSSAEKDRLRAEIKDHKMRHNSGIQTNCEIKNQ